jgi:hypothetical protein
MKNFEHSSILSHLVFKGGSMGGGHGNRENNPWMKLMGIVSHKDRRHDNTQSQSGSNERTLNM